ncbi:hypothetical protein N7471_005678 [Penicillium samsonianum]|uniref:uncharacterized protein n=1 Tax=Penicillium samsonianum TaxID=1882272 RepID=UPI0025482288|nr:uncharacterized protein N7471_005678 [Penicillium samsonianum]KAJ6139192.1 hypothetical protein N7471_005678 [Penicillium samsonianum]
MPRRVKRGVWNSRLQNQSEKIGMVVILQSRPQSYPDVLQLPTLNKTLCDSRTIAPRGLLKYRGAKGQSPSHRPLLSGPSSYVGVPLLISLLLYTDLSFTYSHLLPHTAFQFSFFSIILYHPSIAFGLLLFSVLVELGTWYAGRCNLIYHHY